MHKLEYILQQKDTPFLHEVNNSLQTLDVLPKSSGDGVFVYTPNGRVLCALTGNGDNMEAWVHASTTQHAPIFSHKAILRLPQIGFHLDVWPYLANITKPEQLSLNNYAKHISAEERLKNIPFFYNRYQLDGGVVSLYMGIKSRLLTEHINTYRRLIDHVLDYLYITSTKNSYLFYENDVSFDLNFQDIINNKQYQLDLEITKQCMLNKTELKIFKLIYAGVYKNKEIAYRLNLSTRTIEGLVISIKQKLSCQHREELVEKIRLLHAVIRSSILE